jgi:hypothetical protein
MELYDVERAVNEAKQTIRNADKKVSDMADLIKGRLKSANVHSRVLIELKKELADFNMHTKEWSK